MTGSVESMLIRFVLAILVRQGRNSAMHAAGVLLDQPRHRAQPARFLARCRWRALGILGQLVTKLLDQQAWTGEYILIIDSTMVGHQGTSMENTYSTGNRQRRPAKNRRYSKYKFSRKSCHCFVFGLLLTPDGLRIPFHKPHHTHEYAARKKRKHLTQAQLAAQIIDELPVPPGTDVIVLGDTAFDAETVRQACRRRSFRWLVSVNANRVFAGKRGHRPRVSTRIKTLSKEHLQTIRISTVRGNRVLQRRLSRHRMSSKQKPRTYHVHSEKRDVHSVGPVQLVFSSTKLKANKPVRESTRILMTNDTGLTTRQIVELYSLRWQIELFFKELKSTLGMHQYRYQNFEAVEGWMEVVLMTFLFLEWTRQEKLSDPRTPAAVRSLWQHQRSFGIRHAFQIDLQIQTQKWLEKRLKSPHGLKTIIKKLKSILPPEYRLFH